MTVDGCVDCGKGHCDRWDHLKRPLAGGSVGEVIVTKIVLPAGRIGVPVGVSWGTIAVNGVPLAHDGRCGWCGSALVRPNLRGQMECDSCGILVAPVDPIATDPLTITRVRKLGMGEWVLPDGAIVGEKLHEYLIRRRREADMRAVEWEPTEDDVKVTVHG